MTDNKINITNVRDLNPERLLAEAIAEVDRLRLAIFFGGCSAVHAAALSEAGGEWAVKAVQDVDGLRAEVAAVDAAISDRGVSERDCGLPLAERVNNIILDLRECRSELAAAEMENTKLRSQMYADDQRAWESLGRPEGTYDTTNVQRLCAEVERLRASAETARRDGQATAAGLHEKLTELRADLDEAVELLGAFNFTIAQGTLDLHERRTALLEKYKETL